MCITTKNLEDELVKQEVRYKDLGDILVEELYEKMMKFSPKNS